MPLESQGDRDKSVKTILRVITSGLAKEIIAVKDQSSAENPSRILIVVDKNAKGYLALTPAKIDEYFLLLEECVRAQVMKELELNVSRWREAFIRLNLELQHQLTAGNDQALWLYSWATGEAQKAAALWQYTQAAMSRKGNARSLSVQKLRLIAGSCVGRGSSLTDSTVEIAEALPHRESIQTHSTVEIEELSDDDTPWPQNPFEDDQIQDASGCEVESLNDEDEFDVMTGDMSDDEYKTFLEEFGDMTDEESEDNVDAAQTAQAAQTGQTVSISLLVSDAEISSTDDEKRNLLARAELAAQEGIAEHINHKRPSRTKKTIHDKDKDKKKKKSKNKKKKSKTSKKSKDGKNGNKSNGSKKTEQATSELPEKRKATGQSVPQKKKNVQIHSGQDLARTHSCRKKQNGTI